MAQANRNMQSPRSNPAIVDSTVGTGAQSARSARHRPSGVTAVEPAAKQVTGPIINIPTIRAEFLAVYQDAPQEANIAITRANAFADLCEKYAGGDVALEALNLKKSGFEQGSTEYVRLSELRSLAGFWFDPLVTMEERNDFTGAESFTIDGKEIHGSWKNRIQWARAIRRAHANTKRLESFKGDAMKFLAPPKDATPAAVQEYQAKIDEMVKTRKEIAAAEEAKRTDKKLYPMTYARTVVQDEYKALVAGVTQNKVADALDALQSFADAIVDEVSKIVKQAEQAEHTAAEK